MYNQIDDNKRRTTILMIMFAVVVLALGYFISYYYNSYFILVVAVGLAVLMNIGGYFYGDQVALKTTGAKGPIKKSDNAYVYRMVENLCIASGLPMPKIYLIEDRYPNAFATGRDPKHASIALTTGIIDLLENEELEGVIAHELSHIKNYDIRLMTIVIVLVGLVTLLADIFFRTGFLFGGGRKKGNAGGIIMAVGLIFLILSPIFSKLIQLAISRKREYLADASGALMTRYPEGLARALEKISNFSGKMKKPSKATAHLFIASPFGSKAKKGISKFFATHPPIDERVRSLREMA